MIPEPNLARCLYLYSQLAKNGFYIFLMVGEITQERFMTRENDINFELQLP